MVNQDLIQDYSKSISELREQCLASGITEEEFRNLYYECLEEVQKENPNTNSTLNKIFSKKNFCMLVIFIVVVLTLNFRFIYSNLQEYIYPGLKFLRKISIPFITLFPSMTELYHETCLVQNPFFTVVDMECWPCHSITSIQVLDEPLQNNQQHTAPYIYKTTQKSIKLKDLTKIYKSNEVLFNNEAPKVLTNNKYYNTPDEAFKLLQKNHEKNLFSWKFNTMNAARLIRQYIPRPQVVPKFGQSTERFLLIDNTKEPFKIPDTECSYAFVLSLSGSRTIHLHPADECEHQCRTLNIELKETYLLWYNWWYWKPVVMPSIRNETLIVHVGSYC